MFSFISYLFSPVMKARSLMVETDVDDGCEVRRGDGEVFHQKHCGWREEWIELWGLEVSEHREMIRVESHNSVRLELSRGEISLIVSPTWWLLN